MKNLIKKVGLLVLICSSCTSHDENIIFDDSQVLEDAISITELAKLSQASIEMAKHVKFENNVFFIDISKEEAAEIGLDESIYDSCVKKLIGYNDEVREIISNGGSYTFENFLVDTCANSLNCSSISSRYGEVYLGTCGSIFYPAQSEANIRFIDSLYSGISFSYRSEICNAKTDSLLSIGFPMEYKVKIIGTTVNGIRREDGRICYGQSWTWVETGEVPFPGRIGENAKPHELVFDISINMDKEIVKAANLKIYETCCKWNAVKNNYNHNN